MRHAAKEQYSKEDSINVACARRGLFINSTTDSSVVAYRLYDTVHRTIYGEVVHLFDLGVIVPAVGADNVQRP